MTYERFSSDTVYRGIVYSSTLTCALDAKIERSTAMALGEDDGHVRIHQLYP
jgi:hypothetical protein